jgi:hypothetical protein
MGRQAVLFGWRSWVAGTEQDCVECSRARNSLALDTSWVDGGLWVSVRVPVVKIGCALGDGRKTRDQATGSSGLLGIGELLNICLYRSCEEH